MELDFALLADAAEISEGKTFILGGGVSIIWCSDFPAPLRVVLVAQFTYHRSEAESDHAIRIQVNDEDANPVLPEIQGQIHVGEPRAGLPRNVPLAAPLVLGLPGIPVLQRAGAYVVEILLDGRHVKSVPFAVVRATPEAPA